MLKHHSPAKSGHSIKKKKKKKKLCVTCALSACAKLWGVDTFTAKDRDFIFNDFGKHLACAYRGINHICKDVRIMFSLIL
jgi:hypothetical protein